MKYKYEIWCSKQGNTYGDYYLQDGTDDITMAFQNAMILYMAGDESTQIRMYKNENDYDIIQLDTFYGSIDMVEMLRIDFLVDILMKQLKQKRDDTIKCIDSSLQSAYELRHADKDITFDNITDYFIHEFSVTVTTIENTINGLYPAINILAEVQGILDEIKNLKYFILFLNANTNTIIEYKHARKEFHRWIKD